MISKKYGPILLMLLFINPGCKKFVEVSDPIDKIINSQVFIDDASATTAVLGLYGNIMNSNLFFASGAITVDAGLSSDEFSSTSGFADEDQFTSNSLLPTNSILENNLWRFAYNLIYQCNAIMDGLNKSSTISAATKTHLLGEVQFMRGFCHFYLANMFGNIPIVVTTDYRATGSLPRSPLADVYGQIITDLKDAEGNLLDNYITEDKTRPNKWTAASLLARAYLYQNKYDSADLESSRVINSGAYALESDLNNVFLANSNEAIWQLLPVAAYPTFNTFEGFAFIPADPAQMPQYPMTSFLINAFEAGDNRMLNWTDSTVIDNETFYYPFKYKVKTGESATEYSMVFRYSEQYLIRSEARANLGDIAGSVSDLNIIRNRAGLNNSAAATQNDLLTAIQHERQVELFAEWGHRWFDLKRTKLLVDILSVEKGLNLTAKDSLYPIPFNEIKANPALTQNSGY